MTIKRGAIISPLQHLLSPTPPQTTLAWSFTRSGVIPPHKVPCQSHRPLGHCDILWVEQCHSCLPDLSRRLLQRHVGRAAELLSSAHVDSAIANKNSLHALSKGVMMLYLKVSSIYHLLTVSHVFICGKNYVVDGWVSGRCNILCFSPAKLPSWVCFSCPYKGRLICASNCSKTWVSRKKE